MPKKVSDKEFEMVESTMRCFSRPVPINKIIENLPGKISRRTLQRRLTRLAELKRIKASGEQGGRVYELSVQSSSYHYSVETEETDSNIISLSPDAIEIQELIDRPIIARTPVGYQQSFLDDYEPNITHFLNNSERKALMDMGDVGASGLPAGTYLRKLLDRLLIDLSWNSSRLEGNTYSLLETENLFQSGEDAEGKKPEETQMILNHKSAIEMLADQPEEIGFNSYTICNIHAALADNLLSDPSACGRIRSRAVAITGTVFHPLEIPSSIELTFHKMLNKAEKIEDPFEQALFVMVQLPYLQPFEDVNKRVSRLAANIPLIRRNLCPLSFVEVPKLEYIKGILGVYELNRFEYMRDLFIWAYQHSCARYSAIQQTLGKPDPLRLKYRMQIRTAVSEVVKTGMKKNTAPKWIKDFAFREIAVEDRTKIMEIIETELRSLHEGSIVRYKLKLTEFKKWRDAWGWK